MQVFELAPAGLRPLWLLIPVLLLLAAAVTGALFLIRPAEIEVSSEGVRLGKTVYGRLIPAANLRVEAARRVDFTQSPDLAPYLRTLGTGLPGLQSGWFRLKNGEKALVYLTDRQSAVYVPTTAGYSLLVSPKEPDAFLSAVRDLAR